MKIIKVISTLITLMIFVYIYILFNFSYRNNEKISGAHSESETRKATIQLLRTIIILTQTLESLPDDVMMTMKLLYYDDGIKYSSFELQQNYYVPKENRQRKGGGEQGNQPNIKLF